MIYIVLGMHKSGTTLVSRMLHASGINMGDRFDEAACYDQSNFYERQSTVALNHQLLSGCMIPPLMESMYRRSFLTRDGLYHSTSIVWRLPRRVSPSLRQQMEEVIARCGESHDDWGFKDPRTCLTYPLWRDVLPPHKLIIVYRNYAEVLKHHKTRSLKLLRAPRLFRSLHAWSTYNHCLLKYIEQAEAPKIVINYQSLMGDDAELDRLCQFVDRPLTDVRDKTKYRNRSDSQPTPLPVSMRLGAALFPDRPERVYDRLERSRFDDHAVGREFEPAAPCGA